MAECARHELIMLCLYFLTTVALTNGGSDIVIFTNKYRNFNLLRERERKKKTCFFLKKIDMLSLSQELLCDQYGYYFMELSDHLSDAMLLVLGQSKLHDGVNVICK